MAKVVCVVAADRVETEETISVMFMVRSQMPHEFMRYRATYGTLILRDVQPGEITPRMLFREEGKPHDPLLKRWECVLGRQGKQVFYASVDFDAKSEALASLLMDGDDCVLLTDKEALAYIRAACEQKGITLLVHEYAGVLKTSYEMSGRS